MKCVAKIIANYCTVSIRLRQPAASAKPLCFRAVRPQRSFVRSSGQIMLLPYLMNGFSNLDETYRKYSVVPADDLIRLWGSKVKGQGHSRPSRWRRQPSSSLSFMFIQCVN